MTIQTKVCITNHDLNLFDGLLIVYFCLGFNQWPMSGNQTTDEVFMNAQEAVGAHRDTQGKTRFKLYGF